MRVVMTGCSVRESNRTGLGAALSRRGPVPPAGRGAGARRPAGPRLGAGPRRARSATTAATTLVKGAPVSDATHLVRARADAIAGGAVEPRLGDQRLAADHLRLRQDVHLLHRAVQPRPGAEPAVRRDRRRGAGPRPRPATARSRCSARTSTAMATTSRRSRGSGTSTPSATVGRHQDRDAPPRPRGADPRDRRPADGRRRARDPAPAVRDLAPVGPLGPADRRAARTARRCARRSTCRSSRAPTRCSAGWAASTRSSTTSSGSRPDPRRPCRGSRCRPT